MTTAERDELYDVVFDGTAGQSLIPDRPTKTSSIWLSKSTASVASPQRVSNYRIVDPETGELEWSVDNARDGVRKYNKTGKYVGQWGRYNKKEQPQHG